MSVALESSTAATTSRLQPELAQLVAVKHTGKAEIYFPNHGHARGGVGFLVATQSRGSLNRLPGAKRMVHSAGGTLRASNGVGSGHGQHSMGSTTSLQATSTLLTPSEVVQATTKEWQRCVDHPNDFQTASRSSRIHDIDPASKWAAISFYEINPAEIKRHLDIVNALDQLHREQKLSEREAEKLRYHVAAIKQRETFYRQRTETAMKYTTAGLPLRPAYAWDDEAVVSQQLPPPVYPSACSSSSNASFPVPAATDGAIRPSSASARHTRATALYSSGPALRRPMTGVPTRSRSISLPRPSYTKVYDRMVQEAADSMQQKVEARKQVELRAAHGRQQSEVTEQMKLMDSFENHLRHIQRTRTRGTNALQQLNEAAATLDD